MQRRQRPTPNRETPTSDRCREDFAFPIYNFKNATNSQPIAIAMLDERRQKRARKGTKLGGDKGVLADVAIDRQLLVNNFML